MLNQMRHQRPPERHQLLKDRPPLHLKLLQQDRQHRQLQSQVAEPEHNQQLKMSMPQVLQVQHQHRI
jgi:hypothetical protein